MTYHRVYRKSKTTGANSGAGTAYTEFTPALNGILVAQSMVFCVVLVNYCLSFFFWSFGIERTDNAKTKRKRTNNNLPTLHRKP
jgi:uncharacterized protein involved in tolerance to divalent cations